MSEPSSSPSDYPSTVFRVVWYTFLKKRSAKIAPANGKPKKIQKHFQAFLLELKNKIEMLTAGLTGLAFNNGILLPAKSIEPKYEPAKIIVCTAESFVNLVFSSVDARYMNTKKKAPIDSVIHYWTISPSATYKSGL